jgi:hypothetical protein
VNERKVVTDKDKSACRWDEVNEMSALIKGQGVTRGYKDGLQPESLADGKLASETKSTSVEN